MFATEPPDGARINTPGAALLGPVAARLIEAIDDVGLKARVFRAVALSEEALKVVDALELKSHETIETVGADLRIWEAVAADVRQVLLTVGRVSSVMRDVFQPAEVNETSTMDLDAAFASMEQGPAPEPIRDGRDLEIDRIVERTGDIPNAMAGVHQLATMLHRDCLSFGHRLRNPGVVSDKWLLLGELQELKSKCTHCLEAIVATLVQPFCDRPVDLVLPRYVDATARARTLREQLVDLARDISQLNDKAQRCTKDQALAVRHALVVRLEAFTGHEAYEYLRPADRQELSSFRMRLNRFEDGIDDLVAFRQVTEGFARFLDALRAINQRDLLVQHDLQKIQSALMLVDAEADDEELRPVLRSLYGRDRVLDDIILAERRDQPIDLRDLRQVLQATEQGLRRP